MSYLFFFSFLVEVFYIIIKFIRESYYFIAECNVGALHHYKPTNFSFLFKIIQDS